MEKLAAEFVLLTADYQCDSDTGLKMSEQHVLEWVSQFDSYDQQFVLSELLHVVKQGVYISKSKAQEILWDFVNDLSTYLGYQNLEVFLRDTHFINSQNDSKSQSALLGLLDNVLIEKAGVSLEICGTFQLKNYVYLDDVLATGKTFRFAIEEFIKDKKLLPDLLSKEVSIFSFFFCTHSWGVNNTRYSLKISFNDENYFLDTSRFKIGSYYKIENNIKSFNAKLNLVYPERSKNDYDAYLVELERSLSLSGKSVTQPDKAYRHPYQPSNESFFTSKENRLRLEQIFLDKGIEIISKIKDESSKIKHRPLGKTYPSYKTLGTGTLFFTWRNISNTCPIVLWWDNPSHNWKGLFPLFNRGN